MPELLLELFSEEIPARMQATAAADLKRLVTDALVERGLLYEGAVAHVTPRRLVLHIAGLPARQPDRHEEKKGPRVGAPQGAIDGFLKSAGLTSLDAATVVEDKKGAFYVAKISRSGAATLDVLADVLPGVIRGFPWPKSMRWGAASVRSDALRWVRPLHSIVATFGPETEEPDIVPFAVDGIAAGNVTRGHRFMAPGGLRVRRFDDYVPALEHAKVVVDAARRRDIILHDAKDLAFAQGLELIEDERLLEEVAGLVEWPVVLMGSFDPAFLLIPPEVIRATIRVNQKCFVLRDGERTLAPKFILVSNIEARDGGAAIVRGNERVVAARLSDAKFFWDSDLTVRLENRLPKLDAITFHEKLGTQGERVRRIATLARALAPLVGADPALAERAAILCKTDLVSEMVGEFPELQGLMGRYYAQAQGEDAGVAAAIEDHYRPQGPGDRVPVEPVAIAVALADKIDTLVGFWSIDEKPTGSKDPFALRRAALGVIRIVLENSKSIRLNNAVEYAFDKLLWTLSDRRAVLQEQRGAGNPYFINIRPVHVVRPGHSQILGVSISSDTGAKFQVLRLGNERVTKIARDSENIDFTISAPECLLASLLAFFADRLKVYLKDKGARHDLIDAAMGAGDAGKGPNDDLLLIVRRVEALAKLLDSDDGKNLLAGYKRAANILRAEEKKDGAGAFDAAPDPALFDSDEERVLKAAIDRAREEVAAALGREDFPAAMAALAALRAPVDVFFEHVTVNAGDPALRSNRLRLLNELRRTMHAVADFSKIAG